MVMERDIEEYDYLDAYINEDYFDGVVASYGSFGWKKETEGESKVFSNSKAITFSRKREIKNKDKLQLLQVYMEEEYAAIAKLSRERYKISMVYGFAIGLISAAIIACFLCVGLTCGELFLQIICGAIVVLGAVVIGTMLYGLSVLKKIEDKKFNEAAEKKRLNIICICKEARQLLEDFGG